MRNAFFSIVFSAAASVAFADGINIGSNAVAVADSAIAIGDNAQAVGANSVAIGSGATATNGVAIGGFQLFDSAGLIPAARLANAPGGSCDIVWNVATNGANPTETLSVSNCVYYKRIGSGTYTLNPQGLGPLPTYFVADGYSGLALPAGFINASSGIFRSGKKNHFVIWTTPSGTFVNFLFATN